MDICMTATEANLHLRLDLTTRVNISSYVLVTNQ